MRHGNNVRKFGREKNGRQALLKGLALSLIRREKIKTTEAKAKELRPFIEKLVTKARTADVPTRRLLAVRLLNRKEEVSKLVEEIAPRYATRNGGYTRITKLPVRLSDSAKMAYIEFI